MIPAPTRIPNIFRDQKISETQKGSPTKWFGTVRQNILTENRDTRPLSYPLHFSIPETFWNTEGFLY